MYWRMLLSVAMLAAACSDTDSDAKGRLLSETIAIGSDADLAKVLQDKDLLNQRDEFGFGPLHMAAAMGRANAMKVVIEAGASVNEQMQPTKGTALHYAVASKCIECIELLLAHGADVTMPDEDGDTALELAREIGDEAILQAFTAQ